MNFDKLLEYLGISEPGEFEYCLLYTSKRLTGLTGKMISMRRKEPGPKK